MRVEYAIFSEILTGLRFVCGLSVVEVHTQTAIATAKGVEMILVVGTPLRWGSHNITCLATAIYTVLFKYMGYKVFIESRAPRSSQ